MAVPGYEDSWSDNTSGGSGVTPADRLDFDEVEKKAGVPTSADFGGGTIIIEDINTGKLYTKKANGTVVEIAGNIVAVEEKISNFPDKNSNIGNFAFLTRQDGSNRAGLYEAKAAGWELVYRIYGLDDHIITTIDDNYQNYGRGDGKKRYTVSDRGYLMEAKKDNVPTNSSHFVGDDWKYAITENLDNYFGAIGKVKQNIQIKKSDTNPLRLDFVGGIVYWQDPTTNEIKSKTFNDDTEIKVDYVYRGGTYANDRQDVVKDKWDNNGTIDNITGNDCAYVAIYLNIAQNKFYGVLGQKKYTNKSIALDRFANEQIQLPTIIDDDCIFVGGYLIEQDDSSLREDYIVLSNRFCDIAKAGGAGETTLYKSKVPTIQDLKDIPEPKDSELRYVGDNLTGKFYIFNSFDDSGIKPNDGTSGSWFELHSGGMTTEVINTDTTLEADKFYIVDSGTVGNTVTLTLPPNTTNKEIGVKNNNDGNVKIVASNNGTINELADITISDKHTSFIFISNANDVWEIKSDYNTATIPKTANFSVKDDNGNTIFYSDGQSSKTLKRIQGMTKLSLDLPTGKRIDSIVSGNGWDIIDKWTGEVEVDASIADTQLEVKLVDVAYNYGLIGVIVASVPNPDAGIYPLDGTTTPPDKLLADKIRANPDLYQGFTVNADNTIVTPNWKGRVLYAGGDYGLSLKHGEMVNQSIQRHSHTTFVGGGWIYSENKGSTKVPRQQYSGVGSTGGSYTRAYGVTIHSWCIVGTTILKLDDSSTLATPVKVTFNGATVGGDTEATIYEGVTPYRFMVDLPIGKMIDKANTDNTNVNVVDETGGIILVQQNRGGGDVVVDIALKDAPPYAQYPNQYNPELLGNCESFLIAGGIVNHKENEDTYIGVYNSSDGNVMIIDPREGINGSSIWGRKANKYVLSNNGIDLNDKSFVFSFWAKFAISDGSTDRGFLIGRASSGQSSKTLHIGYRHDDQFTIAFYADDGNFNLPNGYKYTDIKGKWTHFGIHFDRGTKISKLYINGTKIGQHTHTGVYKSVFSQLFGAINDLTTNGKISQIRVYRSSGSITNISDSTFSNFYNKELPHLVTIK